MDYKKARSLAKGLMYTAMVIALISLFGMRNEAELQMIATVVAVILFVIGIYVIKVYCKCPYCGYSSFKKAFNREVCPNCGRNLETGKKEKKVKRKK